MDDFTISFFLSFLICLCVSLSRYSMLCKKNTQIPAVKNIEWKLAISCYHFLNRKIQDSNRGQLPQVTIFPHSLRPRQCCNNHDTQQDALLRRPFQLNIHIYLLIGYYSLYLPFVNETVSLNKKERNNNAL